MPALTATYLHFSFSQTSHSSHSLRVWIGSRRIILIEFFFMMSYCLNNHLKHHQHDEHCRGSKFCFLDYLGNKCLNSKSWRILKSLHLNVHNIQSPTVHDRMCLCMSLLTVSCLSCPSRPITICEEMKLKKRLKQKKNHPLLFCFTRSVFNYRCHHAELFKACSRYL